MPDRAASGSSKKLAQYPSPPSPAFSILRRHSGNAGRLRDELQALPLLAGHLRHHLVQRHVDRQPLQLHVFLLKLLGMADRRSPIPA